MGLVYTGEVTHLRGHSDTVISMAACKPFSIIVTGSKDKTAIIWDTNRYSWQLLATPTSVIDWLQVLSCNGMICSCVQAVLCELPTQARWAGHSSGHQPHPGGHCHCLYPQATQALNQYVLTTLTHTPHASKTYRLLRSD